MVLPSQLSRLLLLCIGYVKLISGTRAVSYTAEITLHNKSDAHRAKAKSLIQNVCTCLSHAVHTQ